MTPNPSIEQTSKMLRILAAAHVERWVVTAKSRTGQKKTV